MSDIYDPQSVKAVFDHCSDRYITFSLVCSFGFSERWRKQCVGAMPSPGAGGVFSMIEASDPKGWWLRPLYLLHLKLVLPLVERILLRGAQDFAMIGTYSTNFGSAAEVAAMLREHGLEVEFSKYFFGCATGVSGRKVGPMVEQGA